MIIVMIILPYSYSQTANRSKPSVRHQISEVAIALRPIVLPLLLALLAYEGVHIVVKMMAGYAQLASLSLFLAMILAFAQLAVFMVAGVITTVLVFGSIIMAVWQLGRIVSRLAF